MNFKEISGMFDVELKKLIYKETVGKLFVLELGSATGEGSTEAFTLALKDTDAKDKLYISVDFDFEQLKYKPDVDYWHTVQGDTHDVNTLNKVKEIAGDRKADVLFIDTTHTYDWLKKELEIWQDMADDKTVWLFHDTYMFGEYNPMTDAIKEMGGVYTDLTKEHHGLGKWTKA